MLTNSPTMLFIWNIILNTTIEMQHEQGIKRINSLKIEAHPRGHVALCNGSVGNVHVRAVPATHETKYNAMIMASHAEKLSKMAYQEKQRNLKVFRRQVQKRVSSREREKELEMQYHSGSAVTAEHGVIQRGNFLVPKGTGDSQAQQPPDVEDVCISNNTSNVVNVHQVQQDLQLARKKLAAKKKDVDMSELPGGIWHSDSSEDPNPSASDDDNNDDMGGGDVADSTSNVECAVTTSSLVRCIHTAPVTTVPPVSTQHYKSAPSRATALSTYSSLRKVEEEKRKHAASQYLLHRQLFSDMERQQVRDAKKHAEHSKQVQKVRASKESERMRIEQAEAEKIGRYDDSSSEDTSHEEKMEQWTALLAIEEHKRRIQKAKETDRYIQALHQQLKERVEQKCCSIPPLCSCGPTIWDTNPNTCANNCVFYKNPKGYVKALTSVLIHLDASSIRNTRTRR